MGRLLRKKSSIKKKKAKIQSPGQTKASSGVARDGKNKIAAVQKRAAASPAPAPKKKSKNYIDIALQFLREVKVELKKVTWPSRKQTIGSTAVVILLVMIVAVFLGAVDIGLSSLIQVVLR